MNWIAVISMGHEEEATWIKLLSLHLGAPTRVVSSLFDDVEFQDELAYEITTQNTNLVICDFHDKIRSHDTGLMQKIFSAQKICEKSKITPPTRFVGFFRNSLQLGASAIVLAWSNLLDWSGLVPFSVDAFETIQKTTGQSTENLLEAYTSEILLPFVELKVSDE